MISLARAAVLALTVFIVISVGARIAQGEWLSKFGVGGASGEAALEASARAAQVEQLSERQLRAHADAWRS